MRRLPLLVALVLLGSAALAAGQTPPLQAEKTLAYKTGEGLTLDVKVGPVKIHKVIITVGIPGGVGAAMRAKVSKVDPLIDETLTFVFDAENPEKIDYNVTYSIEFLNTKGELIDRFSDKAGYEAEAKTSRFEHVTLKAVLPLIDKVRIKFQAAVD